MASLGNQHSVSCIGTFSFRISRRSKILDWSAHPLLMGQTVTFYGPGFTARRYASAVYAVVVCASVRQLQAGIVSKRLDESSRGFFAWRLPSTYPTLCCKEIWLSPKIRVYFPPHGTLSQTPDLEKISPR